MTDIKEDPVTFIMNNDLNVGDPLELFFDSFSESLQRDKYVLSA